MTRWIYLVILCLLQWTYATPAWSLFGPGCQCGTISGYHDDTQSHVSVETTQAAKEIITALKAQTQQNSAYLDRQVEAIKRIADAEQQNETLRLREKIRAKAESGEYDPNPNSCLQYDIALTEQNLHLALPPNAKQIIHSVHKWSDGKTVPVQENGIRLAAWLLEEKKQIGSVAGIENPTSDWRLIFDNPTIATTDPVASSALTRLVANTIHALPPAPLAPHELQTPAGIAETVYRNSIAARRSAAMEAIGYGIDIRMPTTDATIYRTIADASHYDRYIPDYIGDLQKLDIRTQFYHVPSEDTLDMRLAKNEKGLLQDLIDVMSLNARINYLRLEVETRNSAVLAALLGSNLN